MRVVFMTFVSVDGITQGPGSPDEDTTNGFTRGGWFVPYLDETFIRTVQGWAHDADGYLLGRRTYLAFAEAWPAITDPGDPVARSLNGQPKYVASTTLSDADATWGPVTILRGNVATSVAGLKARPGRELQIHGSTTLGRSLLDAGLVDELRLVIAPVILGDGRRLFERSDHATGLRLTDVTTTSGGLSINTFQIQGPAHFDTYHPADHTVRDPG